MRNTASATFKMAAACLVALAAFGALSGTSTAQTFCSEQPVLAVVDTNGDGIASVEEILAIAPGNADLQAAADQLVAEGYTGIQYANCDGSGGNPGSGNGAGSGNGSGAGAGNGSGAGTGNGAGAGTGAGAGSGGGTGAGSGTGTGEGSTTTGAPSASAATGAGAVAATGPGGEAVFVLPGTGTGVTADDSQAAVMLGLSVLAGAVLFAALAIRRMRAD